MIVLLLRFFVHSLLIIYATVLAVGEVAAQESELIPAETFARLPFIEKARLSPNGEYLAGLMAFRGEQQIVMLAMDPAKRTSVVRLAVPDQTEVHSIRWANDNNILVGLHSLLRVDSNRWYVSRMISVNRLTGAGVQLMSDMKGQNTADLVWIPSDGSNEILLAGQETIYLNRRGFWPSVYRVNIETGKKRLVQPGREGVYTWAADASGKLRLGFGFDDFKSRSKLIYRRFDATEGFKAVEQANDIAFERLTVPLKYFPGTDNALVLTENDDGAKVVMERNLLTQEDLSVRHEVKGFDIERIIFSYDDRQILGFRTNSLARRYHWIDAEIKKAQQALDEATPNSRATIISFSHDRKKMLVHIGTADNPGLIYFYDTTTGSLNQMSAINRGLGNRRLAEAKYVKYKARDGLEIEGILTLPKGRPAADLPLIMMPHGGPWAHDTLRYDYWAQFLANRGYAVLQPNFRGSTGYGDAFLKKGDGQLGLAMQNDLTDGVNWLVEQDMVDPKRVCIMGASYGGYAAMWGIAKEPDFYRCAISIAGVSALRRQANDFGSRTGRRIWQNMTPDFGAVSPINAIDRIKAPLMLIHGRKDVTVDHDQSTKMEKAMRRADKSVEMISLKDADHYFTREPDRLVLLQSIERFLAKHNPAD